MLQDDGENNDVYDYVKGGLGDRIEGEVITGRPEKYWIRRIDKCCIKRLMRLVRE